MSLPRPGASPVEALAIRVAVEADPFVRSDERAVVYLFDPDRQSRADEAILANAFALTPAEARLAGRLAAGDTVSAAARALGIRTTTARTQLARLFAKTGASRQPALVRLLLLACLDQPVSSRDSVAPAGG